MSTTPRRWIAVITASAAIAAVPVIAAPLSPRDIRVVDDATVALAAAWSPEQQAVIDDFHRGGLAEVLRVQGTTRLTQPDQVQIINDFFEGGVVQTEGRRWIALFSDPQQQAFLQDLLTGGVVQIVRNRLLGSTADPTTRAAIIAFFPDEVTDYRGGPITMIQRRLIAAAKGNEFVVGLVNAVFDNPILLTVRRLIGGGPIIGTPLNDLPPLEPEPVTADEPRTDTASRTSPKAAVAVVDSTPSPEPEQEPEPEREPAPTPEPESEPLASSTPQTRPATAAETDVIKTGNKVEPTTLAGASRPQPAANVFTVFGQVAEAVAAGVAGLAGVPAPAATTAPATDAGEQNDADGSKSGES